MVPRDAILHNGGEVRVRVNPSLQNLRNNSVAGSQAPTWEPGREAPASRNSSPSECGTHKSRANIATERPLARREAGAWEPASCCLRLRALHFYPYVPYVVRTHNRVRFDDISFG